MKIHALKSTIGRAYALLIKAASFLQSPVLLLMRLYWGWSFFQTGFGKLMNHERTTDFFTSLNIPLPGLNASDRPRGNRDGRRPPSPRRPRLTRLVAIHANLPP